MEIAISDEQIKFIAIRLNELNITAIFIIANKTNLPWEYSAVTYEFGMISKICASCNGKYKLKKIKNKLSKDCRIFENRPLFNVIQRN